MRVNYKGMDVDYPYRIAEINYDDEEEYEKVEHMIKIMANKGWNIVNGVAGWASCEMADMHEYKEFIKDWKEAKKSVAL